MRCLILLLLRKHGIMRSILTVLFIFIAQAILAQYWIGPKVGYHYTIHDYQETGYRKKAKTSNDHNFEAGLVVTYTASDRYSVHGELYYEQIGKRTRNKEGNFFVDHKTNYRYLSFPILLRVSMGHQPVHWYLNAGPKLSYWLGGSGKITNDEIIEFEEEVLGSDGYYDYKVVFSRADAEGTDNGFYYVPDANRLQYSLTVGGGFYLDLANGARLMVDGRFNWGHSNMGFNDDNEVSDGRTIYFGNEGNIPESGYLENYEYTHNTISFSLAYMFEYNTSLKRKGSSTSSESKATKKSAKQKKKSN